MPGTHRTAQLFACGINILQGHLTQRLQPALALRAQFQRRVIKPLRAIQRLFEGSVVGKQDRSCREHLHVYAIPVHLLNPHSRIPTGSIDVAEKMIAHHDFRFAGFGVLNPWPVRSPVTRTKVRPCTRNEMVVNIDNWHFYCLPGCIVPQCLHRRRLSLL